MNIIAPSPVDQTRMIELLARYREVINRKPHGQVAADRLTYPREGIAVSMVSIASGGPKQIDGTVVEVEPRTAVSPGRVVVQDFRSGELFERPAAFVAEV